MKHRLTKAIKRLLIIIAILLLVFSTVTYFYMRQAKFGRLPSGKRLEKIRQSPNYKDGQFQNIHLTPALTEGYSIAGVTYEFLFKKKPGGKPVDSIPSVKSDLLHLDKSQDVLVWFGHSSYFMQVDGKTFLVDPVFSGNASPIPGSNKAFKGSDRYTVADLPNIDYLIITHDHYDHLDYETILLLKTKTSKVICGLGVGEHFEYWGYDLSSVIEEDWHKAIALDTGFILHTTPARHFSGRGLSRNRSLWMSYLLETPSMKIYIGGDSGYDTHFAEIGEQFGPVDLAILEDGQYDIKWRYIHMLPEEVLKAAKDLNAKRLFPVHSSKFKMANHPWSEPLTRVASLNKNELPLMTPVIGEIVSLKDSSREFSRWWEKVR